jgi:outer membrane lipoprotein-sorting protein
MLRFVSLMVVSSLIVPQLALAAASTNPTADQIFKEVDKRLNAKDESARIVMTIGEASGATKVREIEIRRKGGDDPKVMVKLESPADLRGTALLSIGGKGKADDQWLYLPSSKQTRRIISSNKSSSFMDSEMSYEDMGSSQDKKFANTILKTEAGVAEVESKLISGDSTYSRMVSWIPLNTYLVTKIEYYDKKGALLKVTQMADYKQFSGNIWRAQNVDVKNVQNHRTTLLQLKDLSVNKGLDDQEFTVTAMSDE